MISKINELFSKSYDFASYIGEESDLEYKASVNLGDLSFILYHDPDSGNYFRKKIGRTNNVK